MKIGIMQPYFFPYIGYFQLMSAVDQWVVFDQVQFIDKGWINRNRILHFNSSKDWQFITLPLEGRGQFDRIVGINVKDDIDWRSQILGKLSSYKKKAPFYSETLDFVRECFEVDEKNMAKLVIETLRRTAIHIGIKTKIDVQSDLNLQLGEIQHAGQWALRISKALGADHYINPISGKELFRQEEFASAGVNLSFLRPMLEPYSQRRDGFVAGLSVLDVMMFNSREDLNNLIQRYQLESGSV